MNQAILNHPILINQKEQWELVLRYADDVFNVLKKNRYDLIDPIIIDVIIKLFRKEMCSKRACHECDSCDPNKFMNAENFIKFINNKKSELIRTIESWFNNSFNVPQRWIYIQKIIDSLFPNNANIIIVEIWCWWWQIGKFLTNASASKNFFKNDFIEAQQDSRFVQYYWIDPNLITDTKEQLMMINWDSEEMKMCRDIFIKYNTKITDESRMSLEKWLLNNSSIESIVNKLNELKLNVEWWNVDVILLTSVMKYHFNTKKLHDEFMDLLLSLAHNISFKGISKNIYYISNEVYWKNNELYPFEGKEYAELQIHSSQYLDWIFKNEKLYPQFTRKF